MTIPLERQNEVRALAEPIVEETLSRLVRCGIAPHEIAQIMIMTGAGLLAGSLGPKHAGYTLAEVADAMAGWIHGIAKTYDSRETH